VSVIKKIDVAARIGILKIKKQIIKGYLSSLLLFASFMLLSTKQKVMVHSQTCYALLMAAYIL
jgi:hypothetical protein